MSRSQCDALLLHGGDRAIALAGTEQTPIPGSVFTAAELEQVIAGIPFHPPIDHSQAFEGRWPAALPDGADLIVTAIRADSDLWVEVRRAGDNGPRSASPAPASPRLSEEVAFDAWIHRARELGGSAVIVLSGARPTVKIDGQLHPLAVSPVDGADLRRELLALSQHLAQAGAAEHGGALEWSMPGVGIVGCRLMSDRRGPGVLFEFRSGRRPSAEVVPSELEELAVEGDGLLVVAGRTPRDRTDAVQAIVDLVNRRRAAYIVVLESAVSVCHEHDKAIVSQRLISDADSAARQTALAHARAERPDVLVIDTPVPNDLIPDALAYAGDGTLVIVTVPVATTVAAVRSLVEVAGDQKRLATTLAATVARTSLFRPDGGFVSAYELLLSTPTVRTLLASRDFNQLATIVDRGDEGARSFAVSLADLVATHQVRPQTALRVAPDPAALMVALRHQDRAISVREHDHKDVRDLTRLLDHLN